MPTIDCDGVWHLLFARPRMTRNLLVGFVGGSLDERLDLATLKQVATRHVDESLQHSENAMI